MVLPVPKCKIVCLRFPPLRKLKGVISADANYKDHNVTVVYDSAQVTVEKIKEAILATGYELI